MNKFSVDHPLLPNEDLESFDRAIGTKTRIPDPPRSQVHATWSAACRSAAFTVLEHLVVSRYAEAPVD